MKGHQRSFHHSVVDQLDPGLAQLRPDHPDSAGYQSDIEQLAESNPG